ncbi:MAG: hypothetical protein JOZ94_08570, partial [Xanthobacteraceae bacterium]|nr:hypothetical protein [Xanthobacteraceae bacterium]
MIAPRQKRQIGPGMLWSSSKWLVQVSARIAYSSKEAVMPNLIIKNAKLLDIGAGELRPGASLRTENDKVVEVAEDGRELIANSDITVLDAQGKTLMPGLIDAHVHPS